MHSRLVVLALLALAPACPPKDTGSAPPVDTSETQDTHEDTEDTEDTTPGGDSGTEEIPGADATYDEPPLCSVSLTCSQEVPDEPKVPCSLEVTQADGDILYSGMAGVELRGRSSIWFPKPQYSLELWSGQETVLAAGSEWSYLDTGVPPDPAWTTAAYDDSAWSRGTAPLGYGDPVTTTVSYGPDSANKHVTTWFRKELEVADPGAFQALALSLRQDDGAVVWLNGEEVYRYNMPDGEIGATTLAASPTDGDEETTFQGVDLDPGSFVAGVNVLAVEVHQASLGSSDLVFDLSLVGTGEDVSVNFLDMGGESDWILNGAYVDRALFRNKLVYDLFQSMGGTERYAPQSRFCQLSLNGDWVGIYMLAENIKKDDDRVDIQEDPSGQGGSFIVKTDDMDEPILENKVGSGDWVLVYPKMEDATDAEKEGIAATIGAWQDAMVGGYRADPDRGILQYMDADSVVDYILIQEFAKNADAYSLSVHMWKDVDGKMHMAPWDIDLSFGYPVTDCGAEGWLRRQDWVWGALDTPEIYARFAPRWAELRAGELATDKVLARIDAYREVLGDTVYDNFERWPMEDITFEWDGQDWLCPVGSYDEEYDRFRAWVEERLTWMDANIATFYGA